MKKIVSIIFIVLFLVSCSNKYKLELASPKAIQVNQKLKVTVSEKNGKPIDSIRYYLDGQQIEGSSNIDISDKRLGKHAISATVFYGDEQKKLTNTIFFLGVNSPEIYSYEIINEFPHDENAFTQGLEYYNGFFYETTGQFGESSLRKTEIISGKILQKIDLEKEYFGEGMTIFNNKIYFLTWKSNKGFVFNLDTFEKESEFKYNQSKEGWGLTHNAEHLIKSDGTERLWFLNSESLTEESFIEAYTDKRKVEKLNELEFIDNKIYANIWQQNSIVIINAVNGAIEGIVDLKGLQGKSGQKGEDHVLNGIAYDSENDRLFVTGKYWNKVFEIKLSKKQ